MSAVASVALAPTPSDAVGQGILQPVMLADGGQALIRRAAPDDAERLIRMYDRLSPQTIYRWFFLPAPKAPHWAARLAALVEEPHFGRVTLVALVGDEVVAIARCDALEGSPRVAEFGVLIEDAWQGRGLGVWLARRLAREAAVYGVSQFIARTLGENRPARVMAQTAFPLARSVFGGGEYVIEARLFPCPPSPAPRRAARASR